MKLTNFYKEAGRKIVKQEIRKTKAVNEFNHDSLLNYDPIYLGKECAVSDPKSATKHKHNKSLRMRSTSLSSFNDYLNLKAK